MDNLRGAALMILAMAGFACGDAFIKLLVEVMPRGQVMVYLGAGGSLGFALLANRAGLCVFSNGFWHPLVMFRNLGEIIGTAAFISALALIPLSLATALLQTNPLLVTLGAILFFGETVGWRRWLAMGIGLAGVLVMLRPGLEGFDPNALLALLGALGLAMRDLATRHRPRTIHPLQLSTWGFAMLVPLGLVLLALGPGPVRVAADDIWLVAGAILIGMAGYHALNLAMQAGEVGFVTPFRYVRLVFSFTIAWSIFGERPDFWMFAGAGIVVGAGLYTLIREHRVTRQARASDPAAL